MVGINNEAGATLWSPALKWASDHLGEVLVMASAAAFLVGRVRLHMFARSLNVTVADLDVTPTDIVMIAGVTVVAGASMFAAFAIAGLIYDRSAHGWRALALVPIIAMLAAVSYWATTDLTVWFIAMFSVVAPILTHGLLTVAGRASYASFSPTWGHAAIVAVVTFVSIESSGTWARSDGAIHDVAPQSVLSQAQVPAFMGMVLTLREGVAVINGAETCVVRVAPRVVVTDTGVLVLADAAQFRPHDCVAGA